MKLTSKHKKCQWAKGKAKGIVNQEQKHPLVISQLWLFPSFLSL